jgi:fatty-acyl-CoA synthase
MRRLHLLDRLIGQQWPNLATAEAVAEFERAPYATRVAARSTWEALRLGAADDPSRPALRLLANADPDETPTDISHAAFIARTTQTANALHELGVRPTDAVSFLLPLVPQAFYTLFGAEAAGISNPVNPLLEPHQLVEILRAARTRVLVALGPAPGSDIWEKVQRILPELPELAALVVVGGAGVATAGPADTARARIGDGPVPVFDFDTLIAAQPADALVSGREIEPHEVAGYFHTGGTTGTPKLVRHTHANQVSQAWVLGLILRPEPGEHVLFGLPLFHVGGSLSQSLTTLANGGTLVVLSPAGWRNPAALRNVWRLVERYRPRTFTSVPTVLTAALSVPVAGADISCLRQVTGGGSAIPVAVANAYAERFGLPVLEVYGMTETSSVHTMSYPERPVRIGAVGHPLPYARVRIVRVDNDSRWVSDCAVDEIGVVAMAGPGVFGGYLNPQHNRGAFVEPGWVNSGDLGRIDAEGRLWITGRAKDLVIRGGHNIDPQPIEEILYTHPAVGLAAMVGRPDAYAGELPVAYVQLKPGASADAGELIDWIRERTPERAAVPVAVHFVDPMPLTGVGKVFKPALRWDAATRVARALLADLPLRVDDVTTGAHPVHGSLIAVTLAEVPQAEREAAARAVGERLGPLPLRHAVDWR